MDDRLIFLSKSEHYFLKLVNQAGDILKRPVPESIVLVLAERIFGHLFQRALLNLKKSKRLVKTTNGYRVTPGLLDNFSQLRIRGEEVEKIDKERLRHLCELYRAQPNRDFALTDLDHENSAVLPLFRNEVVSTRRLPSTKKTGSKIHPSIPWQDAVWQVAAELRFFVQFLLGQKIPAWIIADVAHDLGHKKIDDQNLINHMIDEGALADYHDGTWGLTDLVDKHTRSSDPTKKLSNEQRLVILEKMKTPKK